MYRLKGAILVKTELKRLCGKKNKMHIHKGAFRLAAKDLKLVGAHQSKGIGAYKVRLEVLLPNPRKSRETTRPS